MGASLAEHPQVVAWAKELAAAGDDVIEKNQTLQSMASMGGGMGGPDPRGVNLGRSPLDAWTALMISRTLPGFPGVSVVADCWNSHWIFRNKRSLARKKLRALAAEYPQETAKAVLAHLERLEEANMGMSSGGLRNREKDDARTEIAKSLLLIPKLIR